MLAMGAAGAWGRRLSTGVIAMGPTADPRSNYSFVFLFIHSYQNFLWLSNLGVIGVRYGLPGVMGRFEWDRALVKALGCLPFYPVTSGG